MSKAKVIIAKRGGQIHFYLKRSEGTAYLFSQKYTKGVYDFFHCGRSDPELHKFHNWGQNPRLDHTIEKCVNSRYRRNAIN